VKEVRGIWLPDDDEHLAAEIMRPINPLVGGRGTYQLNKYRAALEHVSGRRHAVDVGANVGLWSRVMALDFDFVTAIEPLAEHRACFMRNVPHARFWPVAVGSVAGPARANVPRGHASAAFIDGEGQDVDLVPLDSLGLGQIDFLKMDIEGYEFEALQGGERSIRGARPVIIIEQKPGQAERYGRGQWDAVELLKSWGMCEAKVIGGDHILVWQ
jgi:FkbM family methyltransferase